MTVDLDELAERIVTTTHARPPTMDWVRTRARQRRRRHLVWLTVAVTPVLVLAGLGSWLTLHDNPASEIITVGDPEGAGDSLVPTTNPVDDSVSEPVTVSSATIEASAPQPSDPPGEQPTVTAPGFPLQRPGVGMSCPTADGDGLSTSSVTVAGGGTQVLFAIVLGADVSATGQTNELDAGGLRISGWSGTALVDPVTLELVEVTEIPPGEA